MQRTTFFVDVIVPLGVPNFYTYRVPTDFNDLIKVGQRVLIQFGKTRIYTGIIRTIHQTAPKVYEAKYLEGILDDAPIVSELQLKFWDWIGFYYCANPGEVMNAALPSGLKLSSTSHLQLNPDFNFEESSSTLFTEREHLILDALHLTPNMTFDDIANLIKLKSIQAIINNLIKKNAVLVYEDVKDKYKPKLQYFLRLSDAYLLEDKLGSVINQLEKKAFKQAEALIYFLQLSKSSDYAINGWIKKEQLTKRVEATALQALVKKEILQEQKFEVGRLLFEKSNALLKELSAQQTKAFIEIKHYFELRKPVLLKGVTGSGKTEVYIQLIKEVIAKNKQVLFLIPEIALTTQLITRLRAVFGELVGVYHSRFSENERVEIWNNVLGIDDKPEKYKIILGARSCLFLPFSDLGLIIVDEEHDNSFKQHDPSPRYHARDSALYLASLHKANVLLGSATPSVETTYNVQQQKFGLVQLQNQFVESGGTKVEICDLLYYETTQQMKACLTPPLFDAIEHALKRKEQIILFQNRRGFAPYTECKQCGHVPQCVQCDVSLIYHKHSQKLTCHYCGYTINPPKTCPACGGNQLHFKGMGTEKIEEDVEILFPTARVARMDLDSTRSKHAYKQLIDEFENGQIDILIGTQMVTKGLDFNNVSVVGVLNADSILNFPDFRSFEKAFQLITQVRGRAGRGKEKGLVFIQTTQKEHKVIDYILKGEHDLFYTETLSERKQYDYPPFTRLIELTVISKDINEVNHLASELNLILKPEFKNHLLGPEFPLIAKIKNNYHKCLLIKSAREQSPGYLRKIIAEALNELQNKHKTWRYRVAIDVDPV